MKPNRTTLQAAGAKPEPPANDPNRKQFGDDPNDYHDEQQCAVGRMADQHND
ncbi:MAG: hypothetical protein R3C53_19175 [Pirellulaceae bacterium]